METQSRRARKTSYVSDDYERAQEVLKIYAGVAELDWFRSLNSLKQLWSGDIAPGAAQPVPDSLATS